MTMIDPKSIATLNYRQLEGEERGRIMRRANSNPYQAFNAQLFWAKNDNLADMYQIILAQKECIARAEDTLDEISSQSNPSYLDNKARKYYIWKHGEHKRRMEDLEKDVINTIVGKLPDETKDKQNSS